jgi:ribosomal protein S18 acetylase RimI-like enzyme
MPRKLDREAFMEEHLGSEEIQRFNCGEEVWEVEVSNWLKQPLGEDGALSSTRDTERPGRVWLYRLANGRLVGYGALGYTQWRWTKKKDPFLPLTVITWCAIHKEFWGLPEGPKEERYSHEIMDNLITEAMDDAATHPILGLAVHPENRRAIKFYRDYEFIEGLEPRKDKLTGILYNRMALPLDAEVLNGMIEQAKKK